MNRVVSDWTPLRFRAEIPRKTGAPLSNSPRAKLPMMPEDIVVGFAEEDITIATAEQSPTCGGWRLGDRIVSCYSKGYLDAKRPWF
jgi:hypothetical protein